MKRFLTVCVLGAGILLAAFHWHAGGPAKTSAQDRGGATPPATPPSAGQARSQALNASARALSEAFSQVADRASPTVVSIRVEARTPQANVPPGFEHFFGFGPAQPGIQRGGGSGVVIRPDGHILTNNHVIEHAERIEVRLHDRRTFRAEVVGRDPDSDLAVIKIDARNLQAAKFANSDAAAIGEWVIAIGSPFGLDYSVTTGVLSAKGRGAMGASAIGDYLQTDASINPGNSGGPLVNLDAEVLGINTFIIGRGTGIGFAIPAAIARNVAEQIIDKGAVRRAWIGVAFQEITPELASHFGADHGRGALVSSVVPASPAEKAGIEPGDVITHVNGAPLTDAKDLQRAVLRVAVGTKVQLSVLRKGKPTALTLVTAERPNEMVAASAAPGGKKGQGDAPTALGLRVEPLSPMAREQLGYRGPGGVLVARVEPGSPADRAGLSRGDIILQADHAAVKAPDDVLRALADGKALLRVRRGQDETFLAISK